MYCGLYSITEPLGSATIWITPSSSVTQTVIASSLATRPMESI